MENETRRLIGWLPGKPGGRVAGPGAPPVGPRERQRERWTLIVHRGKKPVKRAYTKGKLL